MGGWHCFRKKPSILAFTLWLLSKPNRDRELRNRAEEFFPESRSGFPWGDLSFHLPHCSFDLQVRALTGQGWGKRRLILARAPLQQFLPRMANPRESITTVIRKGHQVGDDLRKELPIHHCFVCSPPYREKGTIQLAQRSLAQERGALALYSCAGQISLSNTSCRMSTFSVPAY